jgi:leucyl/phenylalanyl-tRNA---protein transferase
MTIYRLIEDLIFPSPDDAEPDGLLAVGGDLSSRRLLLAYAMGIFPWYSDGQPILWWSPDPRLILELKDFHISRRLRQILGRGTFRVTFDQDFSGVIRACASIDRPGQDGTWITPEMEQAYIELHQLGFAHSVESWIDDELAGGVYGVSLGRAFFGESMFSRASNASKVAMAILVERLDTWGFHFLDAQVTTPHMLSLGAKEISRETFLQSLEQALQFPTRCGNWGSEDR